MGLIGSVSPDIGRLEAGRDIKGLLKVLSERRDDALGWQAAEALARLGNATAITALCDMLERGCAPARQHAARLLGEFRAVKAVRQLVRRLVDRNPYVRAAAASALGRIGTVGAWDALAVALGDDEACVRMKAAEALGLLGDERAVPALVMALDDDNALVRYKAREALKAIGATEVVEELKASPRPAQAVLMQS